MSTKFTGRREDLRLVSGRGRYTADHNLPGQAHGVFLRADRPHARIREIDASAALAIPGVLRVITADDIAEAGFRRLQPGMRVNGADGEPMRDPGRPVLATDKVRFVGELVALVVAESEAAAQEAVEMVAVDYEDLPAVVDPRQALEQGAAQLHDEVPGNLLVVTQYGDEAATDAAFAAAAHVASVNVEAQRIAGSPMEPKSCLVSFDPKTGDYLLYAPNQGLNTVRPGLAAITGIDPARLKPQPIDVGGAFGIRAEAYPEYAAVLLASRLLERPVKWTGNRAESIVSDHHGRGAFMRGELALAADGTFLGLRVRWLVDTGAYWANASPMINAISPIGQATNVYEIPAVHGVHRFAVTNATPVTAYRGAGRPNCSYLMERLVDEAARVAGIDRVALRRRNLIPAESFPYRTATGSVYDSGDPAGLLDTALQAADWTGFQARRAEAAARGRLRGLGLAIFIAPSGSPGTEQAMIRFDDEGRPILVTISGPSGQGHETAFPEVAAAVLGLEPEDLTLRYSDPDDPSLQGFGTFGSRSLQSVGGALVLASREVVRKGTALAAEVLEADEADILFDEGVYRRKGANTSVGLKELMQRYAGASSHPLESLGDLQTAAGWPSGAHIAEVEIDPDTGELEIISYVAVDDCGAILNHTLVEGQLYGGLMQGFGQVLGEHAVYDRESGQLLSGSFMDYFMPRAHHLPRRVALVDRGVAAPGNPLGVKGAGEAGATGAVPTLANAVHDALSSLGVRHVEMPYTPARLWQTIREARTELA